MRPANGTNCDPQLMHTVLRTLGSEQRMRSHNSHCCKTAPKREPMALFSTSLKIKRESRNHRGLNRRRSGTRSNQKCLFLSDSYLKLWVGLQFGADSHLSPSRQQLVDRTAMVRATSTLLSDVTAFATSGISMIDAQVGRDFHAKTRHGSDGGTCDMHPHRRNDTSFCRR